MGRRNLIIGVLLGLVILLVGLTYPSPGTHQKGPLHLTVAHLTVTANPPPLPTTTTSTTLAPTTTTATTLAPTTVALAPPTTAAVRAAALSPPRTIPREQGPLVQVTPKPWTPPVTVAHPVALLAGNWCKGSAALTAAVNSWQPYLARYPWPVVTMEKIMCRESGGAASAKNPGSPACGLLQLDPCPPGGYDGPTNIALGYAKYVAAGGLSPWAPVPR